MAAVSPPTSDPYRRERARMVETQLRKRGISDAGVLAAMRTVPRHLFAPVALRDRAYGDAALPLGPGQSISQPYIVALMTSLAAVAGKARVLEIGTGSGYQAAVLAELVGTVYSIEIDAQRAATAMQILEQLHYRNVRIRTGDGRNGWPEAAPFDAILVTAAAERLPRRLLAQLAPGAPLVVPVGTEGEQTLRIYQRLADGRLHEERASSVRFVPLR